MSRKRFTYKIPKADRAIWAPREKQAWSIPEELTVSQWADKYRVLSPLTSAEPGQWHTDRTAYTRGMMDAFNNPRVELITFIAASQTGKTESLFNILGYIMDQDPGPTLIVYPTQDQAKSVSTNRVMPMLEASPVLKALIPDIKDKIKNIEYRMDHMLVNFAWSNSPSGLASRPIRFLLMDEIDKYPKFSGKEADPVKLASERTKNFWNRKIIKCSTPTTREGYIFREYEKSNKQRFYVPCPSCGVYQDFVFAQIKKPADCWDTDKIRTQRLAWYECKHCEYHINDVEKLKILKRGVWVPEGGKVSREGKLQYNGEETSHVGFHISAIYSPWLTFSDVMGEFLDSKDYVELLMNFVNSWLAEIWEEEAESTTIEVLDRLVDTYAEGEVPPRAKVLTAGVDVQKNSFYAVIRGWGLGEESWLIRTLHLESWYEVEAQLLKTRYMIAGTDQSLMVRLACIDSGYDTPQVYRFCSKYRDVTRAIKGQQEQGGIPYKVSKIERYPDGVVIPGGLGLWHLDTSFYKDRINRRTNAELSDPARWHLFQNVSDDYKQQICSEHKVFERNSVGHMKLIWKTRSDRAANHYLDAEVYAHAAADMLHLASLRERAATVYRPEGENIRDEKSFLGQVISNTGFVSGGQNWILRR